MLRGNHGITDDICYLMLSLPANNTNQILTPIAGGPVRIRITSLPTNHATTSVVRLDMFCIVVYCFVDLFWPLHNQVTWYQVCFDFACNCIALYFWERGRCRAVVIAKCRRLGLPSCEFSLLCKCACRRTRSPPNRWLDLGKFAFANLS